jgi:hypothetical protein
MGNSRSSDREAIADIDAANRFLEESFLPEFNSRFSVKAPLPEDGHHRLCETVSGDTATPFVPQGRATQRGLVLAVGQGYDQGPRLACARLAKRPPFLVQAPPR